MRQGAAWNAGPSTADPFDTRRCQLWPAVMYQQLNVERCKISGALRAVAYHVKGQMELASCKARRAVTDLSLASEVRVYATLEFSTTFAG